MFMVLLSTAGTLLHIYVFWRAASVPRIAARVRRRTVYLVGLAIWAVFFLSRYMEHGSGGGAVLALELFGMNWMAVLFLVAVALLAADVVTCFGLLMRRLAPALRGWALVAGLAMSAIALFQGLRPPVVRDYEVRLAGLPAGMDGTVVAAISDLHLGSLIGERWLEARVDQIMALRPDMVVLLGDIVEGHGRPVEEFLPPFSRISAPLGVWAVNGNHEGHGGDEGNGFLERAGITVLHDRAVEVRPGLVLAGVDSMASHGRPVRGGDPIGKTLAGRPPGAAILLSHAPVEAERAEAAGAGLMLSGHTHGGQIWPFNFLVRLNGRLVAGRYSVGGMTVIVSRGAGTWGPRMRLWLPGEILRVTLRSPDVPALAAR